MGGILDNEFDTAYLGLTGALNTSNPLTDALSSPPPNAAAAGELANVEASHAARLTSYDAALTPKTDSGGATAYDGAYYQAGNPRNVLPSIGANGLPAYVVGGEFDIFQRGEPLNY